MDVAIPDLTLAQVEEVEGRIRESVERDILPQLRSLLLGRAWVATEYPDWDSYFHARLGGPIQLSTEQVMELRSEGHSARAIATIIGTDHKTVVNRSSGSTGEISPVQLGLDGKTRGGKDGALVVSRATAHIKANPTVGYKTVFSLFRSEGLSQKKAQELVTAILGKSPAFSADGVRRGGEHSGKKVPVEPKSTPVPGHLSNAMMRPVTMLLTLNKGSAFAEFAADYRSALTHHGDEKWCEETRLAIVNAGTVLAQMALLTVDGDFLDKASTGNYSYEELLADSKPKLRSVKP